MTFSGDVLDQLDRAAWFRTETCHECDGTGTVEEYDDEGLVWSGPCSYCGAGQ